MPKAPRLGKAVFYPPPQPTAAPPRTWNRPAQVQPGPDSGTARVQPGPGASLTYPLPPRPPDPPFVPMAAAMLPTYAQVLAPPPGLQQTLSQPMIVAPVPRRTPQPIRVRTPSPPLPTLATIPEQVWMDELFGEPDLAEGWTDNPPDPQPPVLFQVPSPSPPPELMFAPWQDQQGPVMAAPTLAPKPYPDSYFQPPLPELSPSPASSWLPPFAFPHYFQPYMQPHTRTPTYQMPNGRMTYFVWGDMDGVSQLTMTASVSDMQEHHARLYAQQGVPPRFRQ